MIIHWIGKGYVKAQNDEHWMKKKSFIVISQSNITGLRLIKVLRSCVEACKVEWNSLT